MQRICSEDLVCVSKQTCFDTRIEVLEAATQERDATIDNQRKKIKQLRSNLECAGKVLTLPLVTLSVESIYRIWLQCLCSGSL